MTAAPESLRLLHGTDAPLSSLRPLRAGPVSLLLDGVDLRYLRIGDTELIRRVYVAVRDVDWDTVPGVVSSLELDERDDGFRVSFEVRHARREVEFAWRGTITGDETGRVEYVLDGTAGRAFPFNRIGICVHHPWRETAGARFSARTPAGEIDGAFPDLIGAQRFDGTAIHALFDAFDRLEVSLPDDGRLILEFEGDLWETEDHRNWTDANFKTYSTPIALGRPAPLEAGQALRQRVAINPVGVHGAERAETAVRLTVGSPIGTRVPPIGLGQDRDLHAVSEQEEALLAALAPAHFRVEARLDADWRQALAHAQTTAAALGAHLEVSVHLGEEHVGELADVAAVLADGPTIDRVLVVNADSRTATAAETTRAGLVQLVRDALSASAPGADVVGGTEIYFTELNRTRPELETWDGICYSLTPQIHAFTDVDVVENLDAQAETLRSAHAIAGGKPVIVSPITLRRRVNVHAAGDPPPTPPGELPDEVDVRQSSLLGAAWTAGSAKYVAEAGASAVTYYETTGWRGVVERSAGTELPDRFRSRPGETFPLYHPLADAIEWRGAEVLGCESSDLLAAVGLAVRPADGGLRMLVANLTPAEQAVVVSPLDGELRLRRLNEETAAKAGASPEAFRSESETIRADGALELTLAPYEVVRIDPSS